MRQLLWLATGAALSVAAVAVSQIRSDAPASAQALAAEARSADLLAPAVRNGLRPMPMLAASAAPTDDDVGDAASFGRAATWLGVTNGFVNLLPSCAPEHTTDGTACVQIVPGTTAFQVDDLVSIQLPAKATHSLLCHWFSPAITASYTNPGATPVVARLTYSPTLTVENPVLDDPSLIDPTTGLPFNGRLTTGMTASERFEVPLPAGVSISERQRDSATCIAGFVSRRGLMLNYGLSDAQAKAFFKKPTTVRLNVSGIAQHVGQAQMVFGLRILGD